MICKIEAKILQIVRKFKRDPYTPLIGFGMRFDDKLCAEYRNFNTRN
jgi:hypothetical protein